MKTGVLIIVVIAIIMSSTGVSIIWMEYGSVCNKPVTEHLQKYSNLFDENFDGAFSMESIGLPFGVNESSIQECVNHMIEKRNADKTTANEMLSSKSTGMANVEKLLVLNQVNYNPDMLVVTGGPAFSGDPGCGAVIDTDLQTKWFKIDSISNPKKNYNVFRKPASLQGEYSIMLLQCADRVDFSDNRRVVLFFF